MINSDSKIIEIDGICINVIHKNIRNIHLRVRPPGLVTVSAPLRMESGKIREFCTSKLEWIKKHHEKMKALKYEPAKEYTSGEVHFYLGKKYKLEVTEGNTRRKVILVNDTLHIYVHRGEGKKNRKDLLEKWYKARLKELILPHISRLESVMNVKVEKLTIRTMKSRWGTCNYRERKICLNTELAKKPFESIEYVLIHELAHLLERGHQKEFKAVMDKFAPDWRSLRKELKKAKH